MTNFPAYDRVTDSMYMILYPEDYGKFGKDLEEQLYFQLDKEQAEEVKRLAEEIIEELDD